MSPAVFAKEKSYQDTRTFEREVIRLVNVERAKVGLKPLSENVKLSKVARIKSQDMINKKYFSHYSPTYGSPFDMMKKFGIRFRAAGENIAMGQKTPKEVMNAWMNSAGHRRNILNPNFTQIGVGVAKDSKGRLYWTQMFIRP
ncbi:MULTISPECIES: CAP domain-containing protein [Caloramator]|uniref:CAP domain-containing protein n=1 Tax=Caloramator TaxID=44258 RepID=UPI0031019254